MPVCRAQNPILCIPLRFFKLSLDYHYSNSNYQTLNKNKNASIEVLITNYEPQKPQKQKTLFDEYIF